MVKFKQLIIVTGFATLLLTAGCFVKFDEGVTFQCVASADCPAGQRCTNQICTSNNSSMLPPPVDAAVPTCPPVSQQPSCSIRDRELATNSLLLSEIYIVNSQPKLNFIEIANPAPCSAPLKNVYLSDTPKYAFTAGNRGAEECTVANCAGPEPATTLSNFIARFPSGAPSIGPGETVVIAFDIAKNTFENVFGMRTIDYTIGINGNLDPVDPSTSADRTPTLNSRGETITLFKWDRASDLVVDLDQVVFSRNETSLEDKNKSDKSRKAVDGPDPEQTPTMYADEAFLSPVIYDNQTGPINDDNLSHSLKRVENESEINQPGGSNRGNGVDGQDETSEMLRVTWKHEGIPTPGTIDFCP